METVANNGTKIPYFADNNSRITQCTAQCIADSTYSISGGTATNWYYWTCTSYPSNSYYVRYVHAVGALDSDDACHGHYGVRLACNLSSDILVSDSTDADGCYTIVFNQAPTAPSTLEVPTTIHSTRAFNVTWSAGTDPEGYLDGYVLQRKLDSGEWGEVYRGSLRTYSDTLAYGSTSVQYRVQSYDNEGQVSPWTTSGVRPVINNQPPEVKVGQISIKEPGTKPPELSYTVTDADSETVTVTEYIDDTQIKSYQAELGTEKTMKCPDDVWLNISNGEHTYKVVATDDREDTASGTATFTKKVESIDFVLKTPMKADDRPTMAVINAQGSFPAGCELKIELCNNGNDEEPAWVDVTNQARNGLKVLFENETKTANDWAIGLRVHLARGEAVGPVNLISIGGNYA